MSLYERVLGRDDNGVGVDGKIPVHAFSAILAEVARGRMTGAQAQAAISAVSGFPLNAGEITEANALLATIAGQLAAKLQRAKEIDDVIMLGEVGQVALYDTPTKVKARLGV